MGSSAVPQPFTPTPFTRVDDFTNLRSIPGDNLFGAGKRKPAEYSREHWFMYFWKEAQGAWSGKGNAKLADKVVEFFNKAFEKTSGWPVKERGKPMGPVDIMNPPIRPKDDFDKVFVDSTELCAYLELFLNVGFEWFSLSGSSENSENGTEHLRYMRLIDKTVGFEIRWRAESSRDMGTLQKQGYNKQALISALRDKFNLGQPWHPFSKTDNSSKFWFRKTNGDNDWYTVVSVALDWRVSLGFPKIEQTKSLQILKANQVIDDKFAIRYPDKIGMVEFDDGKKEWRLITRSKIALLLVDTMYFDTQLRQRGGKSLGEIQALHQADTSFPEQGASVIAGKNVMGMIEFIRVHHGFDDDSGYSALLDRGHTHQLFKSNAGLQSELLAALGTKQAADQFMGRLQQAWSDATKNKIVHLKWTATGYGLLTDVNKTRGIRSIVMGGGRIY